MQTIVPGMRAAIQYPKWVPEVTSRKNRTSCTRARRDQAERRAVVAVADLDDQIALVAQKARSKLLVLDERGVRSRE